MRYDGKITSWNDDKGFGFITTNSDNQRIFVHVSTFKNHPRRPSLNQRVSFAISTDKQNRPCAIKVKQIGPIYSKSAKQRHSSPSTVWAILFIVGVGISTYFFSTPTIIFQLYIAISLITFIVYALDKSAAQKGNWRTQERTLHLLALAGGWPGALIAQQKLRHKSKKESFRSTYKATVFINCCVFAWSLTTKGAAVVHPIAIDADRMIRGLLSSLI
jgi:uncharacterized membrane protein YsdA (DUF1294 family)/cold shock CspA family protein